MRTPESVLLWTTGCSVFQRLEERMAAQDADAGEKSRLRKLSRRLRSVHEELTEYSDLLQE